MEFKSYLKVLRKYLYFFVALLFLGALIGFLIAARQPTGQTATKLYLIKAQESTSETTFDFDGYYAQEKARNFTDTLVAILKSSTFTANILASGQSIQIEKEAPQLIKVSVFAESPQEAQSLLLKTETVINQKLSRLFRKELTIEPLQDPVIGQKTNLPQIAYLLTGSILGLAFALFVVTLKEYFAP